MQPQVIEDKIFEIRGQRVMLDYDLAELYEVETKRLKEAVRRNAKNFPTDFMFELTKDEFNILRMQIAITNNNAPFEGTTNTKSLRTQIATSKRGGTRYMPFAFTEHGVTMLASVLKSDKAVEMNIAIVRTFINLRRYINHNPNLNDKLNDIRLELKTRLDEHDTQLNAIYDTLETLLDKKQEEEEQKLKWEKRQPIGFKK